MPATDRNADVAAEENRHRSPHDDDARRPDVDGPDVADPDLERPDLEKPDEGSYESGRHDLGRHGDGVGRGEKVIEVTLSAEAADDDAGPAADDTSALPVVAAGDVPALLATLLFVHGEPLPLARITEVTGLDEAAARDALALLAEQLAGPPAFLELAAVAGGFQLRTRPAFGSFVRALRAEKPKRLSTPALETLAVIAYKQPVVKSDVDRVRGVDSTPVLKTLLDRGLIEVRGYQESVGRPALYGTTRAFLEVFGLDSTSDLPGLPELPTVRELTAVMADPGESDEPAAPRAAQGEG